MRRWIVTMNETQVSEYIVYAETEGEAVWNALRGKHEGVHVEDTMSGELVSVEVDDA